MAALSIVLGVLSLACVALGVLFTPVPLMGAAFSFGAPALAIAGIVVGGIAMSRAKRSVALAAPQGLPNAGPSAPAQAPNPGSSGVALTGVIVSALALLPALLTALTCGVCNAVFSTGQFQTQRNFQFNLQRGFPPVPDAGPTRPEPRQSGRGRDAGAPDDDAPPPAFPAPPLRPEP